MLSKLFYFLIAFCLADLIFLNYVFFTKNSLKITTPAPEPVSTTSSLDTRVSQLESSITALQSATPVPTSSASPAPVSTATRHVSYLPINGSFNQLSYDWVDVPGSSFYFDTTDYPGLVSVNFEANIKLFNGNGLAFARLYDATHSAPIPGSQVQTSSQQDTMVTSSPLTFLSGHNLIKIQIKSLTADTTY